MEEEPEETPVVVLSFRMTFSTPATQTFLPRESIGGLRILVNEETKTVSFLPAVDSNGEDAVELEDRGRGGRETTIDGPFAGELLAMFENMGATPERPFFILKRMKDGTVNLKSHTRSGNPGRFEPYVRIWPPQIEGGGDMIDDEEVGNVNVSADDRSPSSRQPRQQQRRQRQTRAEERAAEPVVAFEQRQSSDEDDLIEQHLGEFADFIRQTKAAYDQYRKERTRGRPSNDFKELADTMTAFGMLADEILVGHSPRCLTQIADIQNRLRQLASDMTGPVSATKPASGFTKAFATAKTAMAVDDEDDNFCLEPENTVEGEAEIIMRELAEEQNGDDVIIVPPNCPSAEPETKAEEEASWSPSDITTDSSTSAVEDDDNAANEEGTASLSMSSETVDENHDEGNGPEAVMVETDFIMVEEPPLPPPGQKDHDGDDENENGDEGEEEDEDDAFVYEPDPEAVQVEDDDDYSEQSEAEGDDAVVFGGLHKPSRKGRPRTAGMIKRRR